MGFCDDPSTNLVYKTPRRGETDGGNVLARPALGRLPRNQCPHRVAEDVDLSAGVSVDVDDRDPDLIGLVAAHRLVVAAVPAPVGGAVDLVGAVAVREEVGLNGGVVLAETRGARHYQDGVAAGTLASFEPARPTPLLT